jgi:glutamate-ammonia-ligase adenylyltransferase
MRARIRAAKTPASLWDVKVGDGRMQDIELFAQAATLLSGQANRSVADGLTAACSLGWMTDAEARALCQIYRQLWQVQVATRLLGDGRLEPAKIGSGGEQFLLSVCDCQNMPQLEQRLSEGYVTAAEHIDAVLAARAKDAPA